MGEPKGGFKTTKFTYRMELREFLGAIHDQTGISVAADALPGTSLIRFPFGKGLTGTVTVHKALEIALRPLRRNATFRGGFLLFTTRKHAIERLFAVPERLRADLIEASNRRGGATLSELAAFSSRLSAEQLAIVKQLSRDASALKKLASHLVSYRPLFELWNRLSSNERFALQKDGLPIAKLSRDQRPHFWRMAVRACHEPLDPKYSGRNLSLEDGHQGPRLVFSLPGSWSDLRVLPLPFPISRP